MGHVKISPKDLPDGTFCYKNEDSAPTFYHVLIIHILNYCALLYDKIVLMDFCTRFGVQIRHKHVPDS